MIHPPHLRLVPPLKADPLVAWLALAQRDARGFVARHGHVLSDPSLANWVLEECAERAWDPVARAGSWELLRVTELWLRLANMHRFFPQPRLVIAYYDTLRLFLPWLVTQGRLPRERGVPMLEEHERAAEPLLERARDTLRARMVRRR
ncbi:MAG: hypothetical protein ABW352_07720 [Polyangiales bacterium]